MHTFKRFDGSQLSVDPFWTTPSYRVTFLSESDEFILLKDVQGTVASVAKGVFRSNHLDIPSGDVDLDPSLYHHYFKKASGERKQELDFRLLKQLTPILKRPDLIERIIQTPEYYLIRPYWLQSGMAYGGACQASIGTMLQAWTTFNLLHYHDVKAHRFTKLYHSGHQPNEERPTSDPLPQKVSDFMLMQVNGSPLSGSHSAMGWRLETKEVYLIVSGPDGGRLPGTLIENFRKVSNVAKRDELILEKDVLAIERLVLEIERSV